MEAPGIHPTVKGRGRGRGQIAQQSELPCPGSKGDNNKPSGRGRGRGKPAKDDENDEENGREKKKLLETEEKTMPLAKRPNYGKTGRVVNLWTNWYLLDFQTKGLTIHQYDVKIKCKTYENLRLNRTMKREIFWAVIRENSHIFKWNRVVYDDMNIMFAMDRIKFENGRDRGQFEVPMHLSGEYRIREFLVKFDLVNHDLQVDLSQLASQPHTFSNRVPLQCIDILLTQSKRCTLPQFASDWYAESHTVFRIPTELRREFDLGASKELWRGMFISTNVGEGWKPMVNLDKQYFSDVYNIQLQYSSLPTLVVGTARAVRRQYVPIELCKLDRPQKDTKPLDKRLQANVVQKTTTLPRERKSIITELRTALDNDVFMNSFGLNLNGDMMECEGRVLPKPPVKQKENMLLNKKGEWRLENGHLKKTAELTCYAFIVATHWNPEKTGRAYENFCYEIANICQSKGMKFETTCAKHSSQPTFIKTVNSVDQLRPAFAECIKQCQSIGQKLQMIFVGMDEMESDRIHAEVKLLGDSEFGIPTQCILGKNIERFCSPNPNQRDIIRAKTMLRQLILKVNLKLGGQNFEIGIDELWQHMTDPKCPTLFLGMDVSHPGTNDRNFLPSLAAVIGNTNIEATDYGVSFTVQRCGQEAMIQTYDAVRQRLLEFYKVTGTRPQRLIVYRDGVSESQFQQCLVEEMNSINESLKSLIGSDKDYEPKITFVLVQKRHHTRFFPQIVESETATGGEIQENGLPPFHSVVIDSEPPAKRTKLQEESPARESTFQEMDASTSGIEVNQTGAFEQTEEQTSKSTPIPSIFVVEETPGPINTGENSGTQENLQTESSCLSSCVDHNSQLSTLMLMLDSPDSSQQNNNTIVRQVIIDEIEDDFSPNVRRSSSLPIVMPSAKRLKTKHQSPTLEELWKGAENDIPPNCVLHDQIYGNDALEYENEVSEVRVETNTNDMEHNSQPIMEEDKQASFSAEVQEHSQDFGLILSNNSNENQNENSILLIPSTSADNNEENVSDNFLINQSTNKTDEHNGEGRENMIEEQSWNRNESPRNIAQILLQLKLSPHLKQFCKEALIQY